VTDHAHGHSQRIELHLRQVNHRGSVLAVLETKAAAQARIAETFKGQPSLVIVYQGLKKGMTQPEIAQALKDRGLKGASQPRVSNAEATLETAGFLRQPPKGRRVIQEGWDEFGLDRTLARILKDAGVEKL
jgi:2-keto-3-deoxy-L-rhamnonate aldolase RhmA